MKIIIATFLAVMLLLTAIALWENHTNTLEYQFRNCTETSDNSGYISFDCPTGKYYIPVSERSKVLNDLSPDDHGSDSIIGPGPR